MSRPCASPEEEEVGVVLHHGVGLAGQVAQSGQVEPRPGGHFQHAAPGLVAQQLHLGGVQQPFLRALVAVPEPEGQRVIQAATSSTSTSSQGLPVDRQDPGVHDDLRQLRPAALAQRPPLGGQLAPVRKSVQARVKERSEEESRGEHPEVWEHCGDASLEKKMQLSYLIKSECFMLGIRSFKHPKKLVMVTWRLEDALSKNCKNMPSNFYAKKKKSLFSSIHTCRYSDLLTYTLSET